MRYIQGTIVLPLILSIEKSANINFYVDTEFAVCKDTRSHTDGLITTVKGGDYIQLRKKLNTKSSTEAELVWVNYVLTQVIWNQSLLNEKGYKIHENVIYQYNQIAIKLENIGIQSSRKRTRHTSIRYYFIIDRVTMQEVSVELCPTLDMIGDYFKKAMKGSQLCHFCNTILGIHQDDIPSHNASGG